MVPFAWEWGVSAGFSVLMNLVYPWQAFLTGSSIRSELVIAAFLVFLSMAGALVSPWLLVLAVAGHGIWDIAKHLGAGVSFFSWYTLGCAVIDFLWATGLVLLLYQTP